MLETYPFVQHTDVTLKTNKTEQFTQSNHNANYAKFINTIKFSLAALDNFITKSPEIYNCFYNEQTVINDTLLFETQQQDPVIRQILLWKKYKNPPPLHYLSEQTKVITLLSTSPRLKHKSNKSSP